jgi:hypothetical protein
MKKQYMLALVLATGVITARAQSSFTTIQYNNKMQPALVLELSNSTGDAEGTILQKLKETGYNPETQGHLFWKKNKIDGFYVFSNVVLPSLSNQKLDMYFKVVQKNNEEKSNSTVYLLVSTGNENFASPQGDTTLWNSSQNFFNSFVEKTTAFNLEEQVTAQENTVKDAQNKLIKLEQVEKDLAGKVTENLEDQKNAKLNIESQNKILEDLRLKRKG